MDLPESLVASSEYLQIRKYQQGGLGVVCRALDRQLNREVAVKFIRNQHLQDPEAVQRFLAEAEITGRLDHPGIAPVYAHGRSAEGHPFYSMRFVEGRDLNQEIDRFYAEPIPNYDGVEFAKLLTAFVSVCNTIAFAHSRGIVHRDIKPQNIRIGRFHETIVLDWGLAVSVERESAHRIGDESTLLLANAVYGSSRSGGTPAYMSPEQLSGLAASPASDIYSLGAVLYRITTGRSTWETLPGSATLEALIEGRFATPHELQPLLPKPLEAICRKAIAQQAKDRFSTAIELASEIERFMSGQPVTCYRETPYERCGRWIRHHQAWARHIAFALVAVAIGSTLLAVATSRLAASREAERQIAEAQRNEASVAREEALLSKRRATVLAAHLAARSIATEIELRGAILREESLSPPLRKWVSDWNANPGDEAAKNAVNQWLRDRFLARVTDSLPTSTWNVQSRDGTQLGRVATRDADGSASSLGKSYRYRDYFHGLGRDLDPSSTEAAQALPHRYDVHVSTIFVSTNTSIPSVSFSTPIFNENTSLEDNEVIGILASTVHVSKLDLLRGAILVDLRKTLLDSQSYEGLVLRHRLLSSDASRRNTWYSLSSIDLEQVRDWIAVHPQRLQSLSDATDDQLLKIVDPLTLKEIEVAVAPVVLANLPDHNQVGWAVLMQP